jgi:serine/threonine protein kinase
MEQKRLCPFCMGELPPAATVCPHCGKILEGCNPAGCLPVGTVLAGRYTVGEMRGLDGEGVLYSGVENLGGFRVTIKEYLPVTLSAERGADCILCPKQGSEVLFKTTRMDFADLYRAIQRITPASGLEAVLDVVEANNTVYAVLENLGGTPLEQWLESRPAPVRADDACAMLRPVFEGVAAMHKAGLVHRGICPENIRVMADGRCRLAGYATVGLRTAGSGLHEQLYEGYSAPEQYTTAQFEGRYTDEYSLAAVFYRMVCGQAPMPAAQRVVSDSNPRARTVEPAVPAYVSEVLQLGLRLKVMERIQTVPQLYQALSSKEYTAELTRTMKPETPMHPVRTEQSAQGREHLLSLKGLLAGILLLLSILILLTLWGIVSRQKEQTPSSEPSSEAASSEEMKPQNLVPNFVGIDYEQIKNNREYTSMYLFRAVLEYSDTVPAGQVMRQEPEAGEVMENGEVIQIVVSQGPEKVEMPQIIGASQDKAIEILSSRGLVASCFMVVNDGSYATGCVVSASEAEGTMVTVGSVITVYIAADPSVQITTTPEEPAATEPTTPETPPEGSAEPEYDTD